jgi:hypothetical protein
VGAGALIALAYYRWSYDSGWQMVVEAQRALVAIETEQNTREIARFLQAAKAASIPLPASQGQPQSASEERTR